MFRGKTLVRGLLVLFLLAGLLAGALAPTLMPARAAPQRQSCGLGSMMAQWTFDPTPSSTTAPAPSTGVASSGSGSGLQGLSFTATGAVSGNAWTADHWSTGSVDSTKYFEFDVSTSGYSEIVLAFAVSRNGTGPMTISVQYSTDGVNYSELQTYSVSDATLALTPVTADFSSIFALDNNPNAKFRIYGYSAGDVAGSMYVDDVTFTGCQPPRPSPTPTDTATSTSTPTATFTSTPTITSTPCPPISHHSLIINEVGWMGTKYSYLDEWIELYNPTACTINLSGWVLQSSDSTPNITFTTSDSIAARGYFLIAQNGFVFQNVTIDKISNDLTLNNSGETLYLFGLSGGSPIDTANYNYDYIHPWPAGIASSSNTNLAYSSMERYGQLDDSRGAWITYAGPTTTFKDHGGNFVHGTPRSANWASTVTITPSPKPTKYKSPTPRPPTPFAHVVINEFLPRAGFDWNNDGEVNIYDEFIEIENLGPINVNLQGWKLDNPESPGSSPFMLPAKTLKPGERAIYYGSQTHILLLDSGGLVRLTNTRGVIVDARSYSAVKYPDQPHCRIPDGEGYWRFPCFPTPGMENTLTGVLPSAPPAHANQPPVCLFADTTPEEFQQAECNPFGADMWNRKYWDDQAGENEFVVPDVLSKWRTIVE